MNPMPPAQKFERWHIDILGPLYKTNDGQEYILLCVDAYSRWVEGFMKSQTAEETAKVLFREIFTRYGAPKVLFSDRGRNFSPNWSMHYVKFLTLHSIIPLLTTPKPVG